MKRLWIAVAMLTVTLSLCVGTQIYQHRQVDRLMSTLTQLEQVYETDRERAAVLAREFATVYRTAAKVMNCYVSHSDIAESEETAAMLPALVQKGQQHDLAMEIARLREELDYLRSVDDLLWRNIL